MYRHEDQAAVLKVEATDSRLDDSVDASSRLVSEDYIYRDREA